MIDSLAAAYRTNHFFLGVNMLMTKETFSLKINVENNLNIVLQIKCHIQNLEFLARKTVM